MKSLQRYKTIAEIPSDTENPYRNEIIDFLKGLDKSEQDAGCKQSALDRFNTLNEFFDRLKEIRAKAVDLRGNGHNVAANGVDVFINSVTAFTKAYLIDKTDPGVAYGSFKQNCADVIEEVKSIVVAYPEWERLLGNLALAVLGAGVLYLVSCTINKIETGNFFFFNNHSVGNFAELQETIDRASEREQKPLLGG